MSIEYLINKKIEQGTLYHTTLSNNKICDSCPYRNPFTSHCRKFNTGIIKVNQCNGGFHHIPCNQCLEYQIQKQDVMHMIYKFKRNRKTIDVEKINFEGLTR